MQCYTFILHLHYYKEVLLQWHPSLLQISLDINQIYTQCTSALCFLSPLGKNTLTGLQSVLFCTMISASWKCFIALKKIKKYCVLIWLSPSAQHHASQLSPWSKY